MDNSQSQPDSISDRGRNSRGGLYHTYQKYDPVKFPPPSAPGPDVVTPMMEWMMMSGGDFSELTEEQMRRAIRLDPSQLGNLGPNLQSLLQFLLERKAKILATYETDSVYEEVTRQYSQLIDRVKPPKPLREEYRKAAKRQQIYGLESLWYQLSDERSHFARHLMRLISQLETQNEIEQMRGKYTFHGRESLTADQALEVKAELEKIDELIEQLKDAIENGQVGVIDLEDLKDFVEEGGQQALDQLKQFMDDYLEQIAESQGLDRSNGQWKLSPKAMRLYQKKLLSRIFSDLQESRTGRHDGPIQGEGAVELAETKPYRFGDALASMDLPQSITNAILRQNGQLPLRLHTEDIEIHKTRNIPKCATVVIGDMSGSMRYDGQYVNVKKMALAIDGLIRTEFPGDLLHFVEMYTFAKQHPVADVMKIMPKPVTIHDPMVQLRYDMSREDITESMVHPHFTNIQRSLELSRRLLEVAPTPNRQIVLITDGLPTAHCEGQYLYLLYPPHPLTEEATIREAMLCKRAGITINIFLLPSWSQSEEDIKFAYKLAQSTDGRVFFTAGDDLDRFVVWDYVKNRREIIS